MSDALTQIKKIVEDLEGDDDIKELNLSNIEIKKFTPEIAEVLEKIDSLEILTLNHCGLETLEGFPKGNLKFLDLSDNKLSDDSHLHVLLQHPELSQVIVTNNKIKNLDTVLKLNGLKKLIEVDFANNPVAKGKDYSVTIFKEFPVIEVVDRKDADGNEVQDDEEEEFDDDEDEDEYDEEDDD